ncbi:MAG: aminomethyl-transferring glycine dehydrogenase subunit GcvPA [Candidatus Margulisiibacteriota bacterium]
MNTYSPLTDQDKKEMLATIGASSVDELFSDIPKEKRLTGLNVPAPISEIELEKEMTALAAKNLSAKNAACFLGAGSYNHFIPAAVKHLVMRSEFYTAYTPYQPEISQGMLQAIFEYQTYACLLTGLDVSNASLYDGATALAEAASIAYHKTGRNKILVSSVVHPEWRAVLKTYAKAMDKIVEEIPYDPATGTTSLSALKNALKDDVAAVALPQVNFFGIIEDLSAAAETIKKNGSLAIATFDPISLGLLTPPGELGFDLAVGEGQSLGNAMNLGGPGLGMIAAKKELVRFLPGRIVGQTVDHHGKRCFVLTLQAREQHIRREKASSNICSNEALCALTATVYLSLLGKNGLKKVAELCLNKANYLREKLAAGAAPGFALAFAKGEPLARAAHAARAPSPIFKEFVVKCPASPVALNKKLAEKNIIGGLALERYYPELKNHWLLCVTEVLGKRDLDYFLGLLR